MKKLSRNFYNRDTIIVAQELLGKYFVHVSEYSTQIGMIVEVEAYLGSHDPAAHSSKGITKRTQIMFGPPGFAYVFLVYGMYYCMNIVTEQVGQGSAILLRAVEPIQNIYQRTNGPGLLCRAMHIDMQCNQKDLTHEALYVAEVSTVPSPVIVSKPRIGVAYAGKEWASKLLRFYIKGNPFISKK